MKRCIFLLVLGALCLAIAPRAQSESKATGLRQAFETIAEADYDDALSISPHGPGQWVRR